jgi:hypothetical protein
MLRRRRRRDRTPGQALVEFSLVLIPFLILLMGVFDLGRGIYMMNGTAEAAREIARVTSVHPYDSCTALACDLGSSTQAANVMKVQRALIPNLTIAPSTDIVCVDITDTVIPDRECRAGDWIRVRVQAPFAPVTPVVSMFGTHTFESFSRIKVQ